MFSHIFVFNTTYMEQTLSNNTAPLLHKISYTVVLSAVAFVMASSGVMKFLNTEMIANNFAKWNLVEWQIPIGVIEIAGTILFLIPRTNQVGVLTLSAMLAGAVFTHVQHQEPFFFPLA